LMESCKLFCSDCSGTDPPHHSIPRSKDYRQNH
jgi:hypothetical protein